MSGMWSFSGPSRSSGDTSLKNAAGASYLPVIGARSIHVLYGFLHRG
jgi:hypothetical protein